MTPEELQKKIKKAKTAKRDDPGDYVEMIIGGDVENFEKWAFGEDFDSSMEMMELMDRWNAIHSDDLKIHPDDEVVTTLNKMLHIYIKKQS